jgi:hypothetical protein
LFDRPCKSMASSPRRKTQADPSLRSAESCHPDRDSHSAAQQAIIRGTYHPYELRR